MLRPTVEERPPYQVSPRGRKMNDWRESFGDRDTCFWWPMGQHKKAPLEPGSFIRALAIRPRGSPSLEQDCHSALLTDLYELTMAAAYFENGFLAPANFELFVRSLPPERSYLVAAGLEQALDYLATLRFRPENIEYLRRQTVFRHIRSIFRLSGDVPFQRRSLCCSRTHTRFSRGTSSAGYSPDDRIPDRRDILAVDHHLPDLDRLKGSPHRGSCTGRDVVGAAMQHLGRVKGNARSTKSDGTAATC